MNLKELETQLELLIIEKTKAVKARNYDLAASLRGKTLDIEDKIKVLTSNNGNWFWFWCKT